MCTHRHISIIDKLNKIKFKIKEKKNTSDDYQKHWRLIQWTTYTNYFHIIKKKFHVFNICQLLQCMGQADNRLD